MEPEFFLELIRRHLPLLIDRAEYSDENLSIGGREWSFNSTSPWRILAGKRLHVGSYEDDSYAPAAKLVGRQIVRVEAQGSRGSMDPSFELDDGSVLEVFSCHFLEPWILRLPDEPIVVASPSAEEGAA
ncbi:MAG: hypothetical protein KC616_15455 [Myxococcales bacterium]|nr:hypothetical protein [Myxococcales bacterium]